MSSAIDIFLKYHHEAGRLLRSRVNVKALRARAGRFSVLPPTARQLAEECEQLESFKDFAGAAIPHKGSPKLWAVSKILRRGGFYHALLEGGSGEDLWRALSGRFEARQRTLRTLVLLDGCAFPVDKFPVLELSVERLPTEEIESLDPQLDVSESFFPQERIDPVWFNQQWFLCRDSQGQERPGMITVRWPLDVIGAFWKPLLALALYSTSPFDVPIVIESEKDWRLERLIWRDPAYEIFPDEHATKVPRRVYRVTREEFPRFEKFLRLIESALASFTDDMAIRLAARRYLRAMMTMGFDIAQASGDEEEDALLQYVFAIEQLLLQGEREAIADKIGQRCAYLIALDNDGYRWKVFQEMKALYDRRSRVVHGTSGGKKKGKQTPARDVSWLQYQEERAAELERRRDLVRRVLLAVVVLRACLTSDEEWKEALQRLPLSRRLQDVACSSAREAFGLISAGSADR